MTTTHITLLVPGLTKNFPYHTKQLPHLPALETILARSNHTPVSEDSFSSSVLQQFKIDQNISCNAAIDRYADSGNKDERIWMHVDPVYMEADKDRLILRGNQVLELDKDSADMLLKELNALYADDGYVFECYHPHRWYLSVPHLPASKFHSLENVLGRSVEPFLPTGDDQSHWHRFMNEVQMLLHASEINHQRAIEQQYPVNSVWCWGPGHIPELSDSGWDAVVTDDVFVKGLSLLTNSPVYPVPQSTDELLGQALTKKPHGESQILMVMGETEEDLLSQDINDYQNKLLMLEKNWFSPLLKALKSNTVSSINIQTCHGDGYQLNKKMLRRFWRKNKKQPLANDDN